MLASEVVLSNDTPVLPDRPSIASLDEQEATRATETHHAVSGVLSTNCSWSSCVTRCSG